MRITGNEVLDSDPTNHSGLLPDPWSCVSTQGRNDVGNEGRNGP